MALAREKKRRSYVAFRVFDGSLDSIARSRPSADVSHDDEEEESFVRQLGRFTYFPPSPMKLPLAWLDDKPEEKSSPLLLAGYLFYGRPSLVWTGERARERARASRCRRRQPSLAAPAFLMGASRLPAQRPRMGEREATRYRLSRGRAGKRRRWLFSPPLKSPISSAWRDTRAHSLLSLRAKKMTIAVAKKEDGSSLSRGKDTVTPLFLPLVGSPAWIRDRLAEEKEGGKSNRGRVADRLPSE